MTRNYDFIESGGAPIKAWIKGVVIEDGALEQVKMASRLPFVKGVALMPDVHKGIGSTIGSVVTTTSAIVPAMVGVDIGCGMMAHRTSLFASALPDSLSKLRSVIEAHVPHGWTDRGGDNDRGSWGTPPPFVEEAWKDETLWMGLGAIAEKHPKLERASKRAYRHLSTLGTGNHFVEICLDDEQRVWVMLHSGSRGIGNAIGRYFIELAKEDMRRWFVNLPDQDLAYLPEGTEHFDDYIKAVSWAQYFARVNRELMMSQVLLSLRKELGVEFETDCVAVNCHHNYVERENHFGQNVWVTRKGAVRARTSDLGIIPGSMGARSYIVRGKGNAESFHSCSHGAGRLMSRGEAKRRITLEEHILATQHVECRKDADVIDESPAAYKPIDAVMAAQDDLVEVAYELTQILNVKG